MKKVISAFVLALALFSAPAFASEITVAPTAAYHIYDGDLKNSLGAGAEVSVKDAFGVKNLVTITGAEFVSSDFETNRTYSTAVKVVPFGSASFNSTVQDSLDQVILSQGLGYSFGDRLGVKNLDVVTFASADGYFINSDTITVDNTVGVSTGVKASYAVKDNVSVFAEYKRSWANTDSSVGEIDLDSNTIVGGVTIKI